jgi:dihydrofolate reductase
MRKLILETQVSIDGFIAEPDGNTNWMIWNWGPDWKWAKDLQKHHTDLTLSADCILISRQMAEEGFIAHWKQASENADSPLFTFAHHVTKTPKVVFSNTLTKSVAIPGGWDTAEVVSGNFIEQINQLKSKPGKNILVYGGATLVSSLIKERLIDEFHILVNPVALGNGLSIFKTIEDKQNMILLQSKSFSCGMVLLQYKLIRD